VLDALLAKEAASGRDHLITQDNGASSTFALRAGRWKLHRYDRGVARNVVVEAQLANTEVPQFQLFDLEADSGEKSNVIEEQPEIAARLKGQLARIIEEGRSRP
jgi:arylsulfatase A